MGGSHSRCGSEISPKQNLWTNLVDPWAFSSIKTIVDAKK